MGLTRTAALLSTNGHRARCESLPTSSLAPPAGVGSSDNERMYWPIRRQPAPVWAFAKLWHRVGGVAVDADDLWLPDDPGTGAGGPALFGALLACFVVAAFATLIVAAVVNELFPVTASWPRQITTPVLVALPILATLGLWLRDHHVRTRAASGRRFPRHGPQQR